MMRERSTEAAISSAAARMVIEEDGFDMPGIIATRGKKFLGKGARASLSARRQEKKNRSTEENSAALLKEAHTEQETSAASLTR
jgi:hypothetical protein